VKTVVNEGMNTAMKKPITKGEELAIAHCKTEAVEKEYGLECELDHLNIIHSCIHSPVVLQPFVGLWPPFQFLNLL
jgi:hypothetical protein